MKKSLLSLSIGFIFLPFVSVAPAIAQSENPARSHSQVLLLTQADPSAEIESLYEAAAKLTEQKKYLQAEQKYQQILNLVKAATGEDSSDLADVYFQLGVLNTFQENYSEAEANYEAAVRVDPEFVPAIINLGLIAYELGEVDKAVEYWQSAIEINNDSSVTEAKLALAVTLYQQKKQEQAFTLAKQALGDKIEFEDLAVLERNLWGDKLLEDADVLLAEEQIQTFIAGVKKAFELNQQAIQLYQKGRYSEAEPLFTDALAMRKRLYPQDHPAVALSLNNLASLYNDRGRYSDAEPLYTDALAMYKRLYPQDHPAVATSLNNLADLYRSQGRYSDAEPLLTESLAMTKRLFPNDHPDLASSLNNLAVLYKAQGRYGDAEPLYTDALAMTKRLFPQDHHDVASSLSNIGLFYQAQSQYPQALNYLTQAAQVEETIIAENLLIGSEQQKKQFLDLFQNNTDTTISFHLTAVPNNSDAAQLALTTILRRKGRVLDAMGQTLQTLRDNLDPTSQQLFVQLASTQTELANLSSRPLPNEPTQLASIQTQQQELDQQIKQLEAQLSSRSAEFKQETTPVTIPAVQQAIPNDAALVEFIQYSPFNPKATSNNYSEPRYAVYVLLPNGQIKWQDLGEASVIDDKIQSFRTLLGNGEGTLLNNDGENDDDRGLGPQAKETGIEATKEVARELDQMLMKPVRAMVGNATHLLLSPDSTLNLLPFAALVDEQDKYLVENYLITYLTSGRDLLRLQLNQDREPATPLLMANPTYSRAGITVANTSTEQNRGRRSAELATLEFGPLPGTKVEGEAISQIVPNLNILTEQQASENNLKQTKNPKFLHLATHGFFLPPQPEEANNDRNQDTLSLDNQTPVFSTAENPLLRSGLAFAGFNQRDSGDEDGVLTALEVTGLNLRGTKLVVTSACETGLGDVQAGEGVYGLRRAFTLAGAQSQLMSLWNVSDEGTKDLMVNYYTKIQNGEARGEALRQVQLEMLQSEDRNHPYFWAAFIPSGAWSPLDSGN